MNLERLTEALDRGTPPLAQLRAATSLSTIERGMDLQTLNGTAQAGQDGRASRGRGSEGRGGAGGAHGDEVVHAGEDDAARPRNTLDHAVSDELDALLVAVAP